MKRKKIKFDHEAISALGEGVRELSHGVSVTLGPAGKHVLIEKRKGDILATKDGVTVASYMRMKDPAANCGMDLARIAAENSSHKVGDGTTTSTVLAGAIYEEGMKLIAAGVNPMALRRGLEKLSKEIIRSLRGYADTDCTRDDLVKIATIACNSDREIGILVADAVTGIGEYGTISLEVKATDKNTVEIVNGAQFTAPFVSSEFSDKAMQWSADNVLVALCGKELVKNEDIEPLLEIAVEEDSPIFVIAPHITGDALKMMLLNHKKGIVNCCGSKALYYARRQKDFLVDLCVLTGAKLLGGDDDYPIENATIDDLGKVEHVLSTRYNTTFSKPKGDSEKVLERIEYLTSMINNAANSHEHRLLNDRLACMAGSIAKIVLGGLTTLELEEKKARAEDAVHATRAAAMSGVLPGGGIALLKMTEALSSVVKDGLNLAGDELYAIDILKEALAHPFKLIMSNAGWNGEALALKVIEDSQFWNGFDAITCEYGPMRERIIDPTDVVTQELQCAVSIAGLIISSGCVVTIMPEDKETHE